MVSQNVRVADSLWTECRPSNDRYKAGHWQIEKGIGRPLTKEEFAKLVGAGIDVPFTGIVYGGTALIKVPAGWQHNKFQTKTGYILLWLLGPLELTRM